MRLPRPFVRLPLRFDAERLLAELHAIPEVAWTRHPTGFAGNSAVRLISVDGGDNDLVGGAMQATSMLKRSPYLQQILAGFGVVWSRSRLMKLAPGADVLEHADINYHWFSRVRVHIPILTNPKVRFFCGDESVHMAAGEAWVFDNWRLHRVENQTPEERVHLVADTTGSAAFWQLVNAGLHGQPHHFVPFMPGRLQPLAMERHNTFRVMPPAELEQLLGDLAQEASAEAQHSQGAADVQRFSIQLEALCNDWRQLWALYADTDEGLPHYRSALDAFREQVQVSAQALRARTNRVPAMKIFNARVQFAVNSERRPLLSVIGAAPTAVQPAREAESTTSPLDAPIFIVAAPRSGSTLLFETLACASQIWTVGGEAHWLVEGFPHLCPGAPGVDSNRLTAAQAAPELRELMVERIAERLRDAHGIPIAQSTTAASHFLEKTPKNSLRIPFFRSLFPDARFIFLWRDPRENISSIIEAWKSGRWVTYPRLAEWEGPWSLLLPPGWSQLRGQPLQRIAAFQWAATNTIVMDDLMSVKPERRMVVRYDELVRAPSVAVQRICSFAGIEFDSALRTRTESPLPQSRYTLTAPRPEKWKVNHDLIAPLIPELEPLLRRLESFG